MADTHRSRGTLTHILAGLKFPADHGWKCSIHFILNFVQNFPDGTVLEIHDILNDAQGEKVCAFVSI